MIKHIFKFKNIIATSFVISVLTFCANSFGMQQPVNQNQNGDTPLHIACRNGNTAEVNQLALNNTAINATNNLGDTPLHIACKNDNYNVTAILIQNHAKIDIKNNDFKTPFQLACEKNSSLIPPTS